MHFFCILYIFNSHSLLFTDVPDFTHVIIVCINICTHALYCIYNFTFIKSLFRSLLICSYKTSCTKQCSAKISCNYYQAVMHLRCSYYIHYRLSCRSLRFPVVTEFLYFIIISYNICITIMSGIPIFFLNAVNYIRRLFLTINVIYMGNKS